MNIGEIEYIQNLLKNLIKVNNGWLMGDKEEDYKNIKSADLVNHTEKLVIEVKDDFSESPPELNLSNPLFIRTRNLETLSNRYKSDISDAHNKFKNYQGYESAVIIRFNDFTFQSILYLLGGLVRIRQDGSRIKNKNVNISRDSSECSLYIFHNERYNELRFYKNPVSYRKYDKLVSVIKEVFPDIKEILVNDLFS